MKPIKWNRKHSFTLVAIIMLLVIGYSSSYLGFSNYDRPQFPGYGASKTRISSVNLAEVEENAVSSGYTSRYHQTEQSGDIEIPEFLGKGKLHIEYYAEDKTNQTRYSYDYGSDSDVLEEFWGKISYYLNLTREHVEEEKEYFNNSGEVQGDYIGKAVKAKPIWDRIMEDQGALESKDNREVGTVYYHYESGAEIELNEKILRVSKTVTINGTDIEIWVRLDGDTDTEINLECNEPLEAPDSIVQIIIDDLGLDPSLVDKIKLHERAYG